MDISVMKAGFFLIVGVIVIYSIMRINKIIENKKGLQEYESLKQSVLENELQIKRKKDVIEKVDLFLKSSIFVNPIGMRKNEKIFQYIYKDGEIYEFKDFLTDATNKIGIDSSTLAFRELKYLRVGDPKDFIEKFSSVLKNSKVGNPNVENGGVGIDVITMSGRNQNVI
jgi:hypothetical protein